MKVNCLAITTFILFVYQNAVIAGNCKPWQVADREVGGSVNFVFVWYGYAENEMDKFTAYISTAMEKFFSFDPLKDYRYFFNIRYVNQSAKICTDDLNSCSYYVSEIVQLASQCPYDKIIVVHSSDTYGGFARISEPYITFVYADTVRTALTTHELGHSFGLLMDEYSYDRIGNPYLSGANCDIDPTCPKWADLPDTMCISSCTYINLYRDSLNSIMKSVYSSYFGPSSKRQLMKQIDKYVYLISDINPYTYPEVQVGSNTVIWVKLCGENDPATIQWFVDDVEQLFMLNKTTFTFYGTEIGTFTVKATASYLKLNDTFRWEVYVTTPNNTPVIVSVSPNDNPIINEGEQITFTQTSYDPDGLNDVTYLYWYLDDIEISRQLSWIYQPDFKSAGSHTVKFKIKDGLGKEAIHIWQVTVNDVNRISVIVSTPTLTAKEGELYEYRPLVTDPDIDNIFQYSVVGPSSMSISTYTGVISWIPERKDVGKVNVTLTVSDGKSSVTQPFEIMVTYLNRKPQFVNLTSTSTYPVDENKEFKLRVSAVDDDLVFGDSLTFTVGQPLQMVRVNSTQINLSWLPTASDIGIYEIPLTVKDNNSAEDKIILRIIVSPVNDPPVQLTFIHDATYFYKPELTISYDLTKYFYDIDSSLTYSYTQVPDSYFLVNIDTAGYVTIRPQERWYQQTVQETITFTVLDGQYTLNESVMLTLTHLDLPVPPTIIWIDQGANSVDSQTVVLKSTLPPDANVLVYHLVYGTTDYLYGPTTDTVVQINNLADSQYVYCQVMTYNKEGHYSLWSTTASVWIPDRTAPSPILNFGLKWVDQGPNSGDYQSIQTTATIPLDANRVEYFLLTSTKNYTYGPSTDTVHTFTGIGDNQTVTLKVRSYDEENNFSVWSTTVSVEIPNRTIPVAKIPDDVRNGIKIGGDVLLLKIPGDLHPGESLSLQYRKQNDVQWTNLGTFFSTAPVMVFWNISNKEEGSYELQTRFEDSTGNFSVSTITFVLDNQIPDLTERRLYMEEENSIITPEGIKLEFPSWFISTNYPILQYKNETAIRLSEPNLYTVITQAYEKAKRQGLVPLKSLNNDTLSLSKIMLFARSGKEINTEFTLPVTLSFPYQDNNGDGIVDNTNIPVSTLKIYYLNETSGGDWNLANATFNRIDYKNKVVATEVNHFSVYTVLGQEVRKVDHLNEVRVYPNPFKPSEPGGDKTVKFLNIPEYSSLSIYTLTGELVKSFTYRDLTIQNGFWGIVWDGKNELGTDVVSGIYIYLISAQNNLKKTGKLAILR